MYIYVCIYVYIIYIYIYIYLYICVTYFLTLLLLQLIFFSKNFEIQKVEMKKPFDVKKPLKRRVGISYIYVCKLFSNAVVGNTCSLSFLMWKAKVLKESEKNSKYEGCSVTLLASRKPDI